MSRTRRNVAANIAGQGWALLMAIICTPFQIKLIGIEGYAVIAFYTVLQATLQMLDLGFTTTVNREAARLSASASGKELGKFAATAERWFWVLGFAVGCAMFLATPHIVGYWLRPESFPLDDLADSARLFGLIACLQWPLSFYQNGLSGLQRQVTLNLTTVPFSALSNLGGLLVLWLGPGTVTSLMVWQLAILLAQIAVVHVQFWKCSEVPPEMKIVDLAVLKDKLRFSLGMGGISIAGFLLTYLDKLILSRLLSLESFGHYNLAWTLTRGLLAAATPVFNAYFPRFSALASTRDTASMRLCYHNAAQVMAVLTLPLAGIIGVFSQEIALLWLHDAPTAESIAPIVSLLMIGTCINAQMSIPFALQLAYGNTKIGLWISSCLIAGLVPLMILAATQYGVMGGAVMWGVINALYLVVGLPITHRYLLPGEVAKWLWYDTLPPLVAASSIITIGRILLQPVHSIPLELVAVASLWLLATLAAALSANQVRSTLRHMIYAHSRTK